MILIYIPYRLFLKPLLVDLTKVTLLLMIFL